MKTKPFAVTVLRAAGRLAFRRSHRATAFASLAALAVGGLSAQVAERPIGDGAARMQLDGLRVPIHTQADDPDGGAYGTWAAGSNYKVRLSRNGISFIPYLGADAPRTVSLDWRTESVEVGGVPVQQIDPSRATTHHTDWRYEIRYGAVTEAYDIECGGIEQTFVLQQRPAGNGDLVVRGHVSGLGAAPTPAMAMSQSRHQALGFSVAGTPGATVEYGAATAIDAVGNRLQMTSSMANGIVELRLPAAALASARFPLVVDPFIASSLLVNNGAPSANIALATSDDFGNIVVAYTKRVSAADRDLYVLMTRNNFTTVRAVYTDLSTTWSTRNPAVAYCLRTSTFAIAFQRDFTTFSGIRMHLHRGNDFTIQTDLIWPTTVGGMTAVKPVLGGATSGIGTDVLLAYETEAISSSANTDIRAHIVSTSTHTVGAGFTPGQVASGTRYDRQDVAVAQRVGIGGTFGRWALVFSQYDRGSLSPSWGIEATSVDASGNSWLTIPLYNTTDHEYYPVVAGAQGRVMVVFGRSSRSNHFIPEYPEELVAVHLTWDDNRVFPGVVATARVDRNVYPSSLTYDSRSRGQWGLVVRDRFSTSLVRIGGTDCGVVQKERIFGNGTGPICYDAAATFDHNSGRYVIAYTTSESGFPIRGTQFYYPEVPPARSSIACGSGQISDNRSLAGSDVYRVYLQNAPAATPAFLLLGLSPNNARLDGIGMLGCELAVGSILASFPTSTNPLGSASVNLPLPSTLAGARLYFQWIYAQARNPAGLVTTVGFAANVR